MMKRLLCLLLALLMTLSLAAGCGSSTAETESIPYTEEVVMEEVVLEDEAVALSETPAPQIELLKAEASGTKTKKTSTALIDYSNTDDGYVMVQYTAATDKRLKAQVKGPKTTYTYNLTAKEWAVFPLSEGDGRYTVSVFRGVGGNKYTAVASVSFQVKLEDEFSPFLYPNQYVDYAVAPNAVEKAQELTKELEKPLSVAMWKQIYGTVQIEKNTRNEISAQGHQNELPNFSNV